MFKIIRPLLHSGPFKVHYPRAHGNSYFPLRPTTTNGNASPADNIQILLDMRIGVGELVHQISLVKGRQKRHEALLWVCAFPITLLSGIMVTAVVLDVIDPLPPVEQDHGRDGGRDQRGGSGAQKRSTYK